MFESLFLVEILHTGYWDVPEMKQWCFDQWGEESQRMIWWCISTDMNVSGAKAYHKFYFKNAEDAAFFKLSWHR
jgi:hypothetical protein